MKYADTLRAMVATLDEERDALIAEIEALTATPTAETRGLNDAEEARHAEIVARAAAIKTERAVHLARAAELDTIEAERNASPKAPNFIPARPEPAIEDTTRMNFTQASDMVARNAEEHGIESDNARALLRRHRNDMAWVRNIAARSTAAYQSAFVKLVTGRDAFLTTEERAAIAVGTNTQGGYLVPTHLDPTLILTNSGSSNAIRAISRVVTLTNENTWHGVTTAGSTFSWDAELAEVSDDSPGYDTAGIPVYTGRGFVQASVEAFDDIANLASDVLMLFADGRDRLEGAAHATGSGSAQPTGIFTALDANTNVEVTSATAATIALADLQGLKRAVPIRWRGKSTWVMNPVYGDAIKVLGTALSASYSTDITQSNTDLLLGRPLVETDDAPTTQTTTVRDNEIVIGDFSNYVIVDKPGSTSIQFIPTMFNTANNLPDGRSGWFMRFRSGADSVNDLAFRLLQDKTSA